jgi:hypothetical protein
MNSPSSPHFQGAITEASIMIPLELSLVEDKDFWEVLISCAPISTICVSFSLCVWFNDLWDFFQLYVGEKLRWIGHRFNVRTIFKTEHTPHGTRKLYRVKTPSRQRIVCTVFHALWQTSHRRKQADFWKQALSGTNTSTTRPKVCSKNQN